MVETEDYNLSVISSTNCANVPVAGIAQSTAASVCSANTFTLMLSGYVVSLGSAIQWQSRPAGSGTWTSISGATNTSLSVSNQTVSTDYRAYIYCNTSSDTSTVVTVSQNPISQCYCSPNTGTPLTTYSSNYITNVALSNTTLNNSTTTAGANGYTLVSPSQTNATATLVPGDYYSFTVSLDYYTAMAVVWIDYNANGSFETSELIPLTVSNTSSGVKGTAGIIVPSTATGGVTGLRVTATSGSSIPGPCVQLYYGEVEDYSVSIVTLPSCANTPNAGIATAPATACPGNPIVLTVIGSTAASGLSYQWQSKASSGTTWADIANATNKSYIIPSQTSATDYRLIVACGANADTSTVASVAQSPLSQCYCSPNNGTNLISYGSSNEVKRVEIIGSTLNYPSTSTPTNGYTLVPPTPATNTATLNAGFTYQIKTTLTSTYPNVGVWIDYNGNALFEASEKTLLNKTDTIADGLITIPAASFAGDVGMRVIATNNPIYNACDMYYYGEVEDYTITLGALPACTGIPSAGSAISTLTTVCIGDPFTLSLSGVSQSSGLSFQWQSKTSPNGSWTDIPNATTNIYPIATQSVSTEYRAYVTCAGSSDTSASVTVAQTPLQQCYCNPSNGTVFTSAGLNTITNVSIPAVGLNYSTTSAPSNGYTVVPSTNTATMVIGNQYILTATLSGNVSNILLYIDYNANGVFDYGEMVYGNVNQQIFTATISIPNTAVAGNTVMRILASQGSYFYDPCPTGLLDADVEDYIITLIPSTPCSGTPTAGTTGASAAAVCASENFYLYLSGVSPNSGLTYLWQSKPAASSLWTNLYYTTVQYSYLVQQMVTTEYRVIVTCGNATDTSAPVTVNMTPFQQCYCIPGGTSSYVYTPNNIITNATIPNTTLNCNSTSTPSNGYTQFPSTTANYTATLYTGFTYNLQLNLSLLAPLQAGVVAWIDYNQDGIYDDQTERISFSTISANSSATFTVPSTALSGTTGMRIAADNYNTMLYTCPSINDGEVEDYEITIGLAPACTGTPSAGIAQASVSSVCPNVPFNLYATGTTLAAGLTYQWQYKLNTSSTWSNINGATANNYTMNNQTAAKDYRLVVTCGSNSDTSLPVTVNQNLLYACYCSPNTGATTIYYPYNLIRWANIQGTTLNSVSQVAGLNGYTQFNHTIPSYTATLVAGQTYNFNIALDNVYLYTFFWIDYNRDGLFDNNEYLGFQNTASDTLSVSFTVPANANTGLTGLRILTAYDLYQITGPCPSYMDFAEIEDYIITIDPQCIVPASLNAANISDNSATLSWQGNSSNYEYVLDQSSATPAGSGTSITGTSYNATNLVNNTVYYFHVRSVCANSTYSQWTSQQFTTTNTSVGDIMLQGDFTIYPNPTNGKATIRFDGVLSKEASLEIYSLTGKLIKTYQNAQNNMEIDLSDLSNAVYIVRVKDGNGSKTIRLTKQ